MNRIEEKIYRLRMPKEFRDVSEEEIERRFRIMREHLVKMTDGGDYDEKELISYLKENENLDYAMQLIRNRRREQYLRENWKK